MTDGNTGYDAAEHETFGFIDDEQPNEEGLEDAILDAEDFQEADKYGMTPREERQGTPLEEQLAAEIPEDEGAQGGSDPGDPVPAETDPLEPIPDGPADPNDPDPVPPEPVDPHEPDPDRPEPGAPTVDDPLRPFPDEPVQPPP